MTTTRSQTSDRNPARNTPGAMREGQPLAGRQERATGSTMSGEQGNDENSQPRDGEAGEGPSGPNLAHLTPMEPTVQTELEELRKWMQDARDREELERLQEAQRKYDASDLTAIQPALPATVVASARPTAPRTVLPRPEPPHVYKKKNRADYNMWTEEEKVTFGLQYVSEMLKTVWDTYVTTERRRDALWVLTWAVLKGKMLSSLGTLTERRQDAFDQIKKCKQHQGQTPTELLNYLRPLWEEVGESSEARMVNEFVSALSENIRNDLAILPQAQRETLPEMEEHVNVIYRRCQKPREAQDTQSKPQQQLSRESKELGTLHELMFRSPAKLLTVSLALGGLEQVEALVDPGAQLNLLDAKLAKQKDLVVDSVPKLLAETVNGSEIPIYGTTSDMVTITDSRGNSRTHEVPFVVAYLRRYKVYLGLPWIIARNPKMNFLTQRLLFQGEKDKNRRPFEKIALEDAEQFAATLAGGEAD
ncbi:hypothetical protein EJ04DRAFT_530282, partial [Polyplosphaeria fusca]